METRDDARTEVLGRIGAALGRACSLDDAQRAWLSLPRDYQASSDEGAERTLHLLEERLRDYGAYVERVATCSLREAISQRLAARNHPRMLLPSGVPRAWLPDEVPFAIDEAFDNRTLDTFGGVLTLATLAIASTGTVVLQSVPGQGRRAITLVPDYHLCLVDAATVVATVPQAIRQLQQTARLATTFISGPSATADIEMTRIQGVHGPRVLDVLLLVEQDESAPGS